ncbi:MAG: ankyrin repeat protein [Cocleimonas sp.]|jgi:ankyrin repeat protein
MKTKILTAAFTFILCTQAFASTNFAEQLQKLSKIQKISLSDMHGRNDVAVIHNISNYKTKSIAAAFNKDNLSDSQKLVFNDNEIKINSIDVITRLIQSINFENEDIVCLLTQKGRNSNLVNNIANSKRAYTEEITIPKIAMKSFKQGRNINGLEASVVNNLAYITVGRNKTIIDKLISFNELDLVQAN